MISRNLPGDIRDEVRRGLRGADRGIDTEGQRTGGRINDAIARGMRADERLRQAGMRLNQQIADGFRRDRSLDLAFQREARLAADSLGREIQRRRGSISRLFKGFGNGIGRDLASEFRLGIGAGRPGPAIVAMISLAGPSAFGAAAALGVAAAGALTAAISSTLLTGGLLAAAFASGAESLELGKEKWGAAGKRLGTLVADGMATGFANSASIFTDKVLPAIEGPLTRTGEAFGRMFEGLADTLSIPENLSRLGQILDNNVRFIDSMSAGLQGLTSAFLTLFAASKPMIDLVGDRFKEFGQWAASALAAAEANGNLAIVMDKLTKLASAMFGWIAKIGPAFGDWLLNLDVDKIIKGWETFGAIMGDVFDILGQIADGAGPHFQAIMENIHRILSNIVNSGIIETIADRVAGMLESFTGFVAMLSDNPIAAKLLGIGLALLLFGGFISPIITILGALKGAFLLVAGALGTAALPILAVVAVFGLLLAASEDFRLAIGNLVTELAGTFMEVWDKLWPKIESTWNAIWRLAEAIGNGLAPMIRLLTPVLQFLMHLIGGVLTVVLEVIGLLANFLYGFLTGDWEPFIAQITRLWLELRAFLQERWQEFVTWFQGKWTELTGWFGGIWNDLTTVIGQWWDGQVAWFAGVWAGLVALFHVWWDPIVAYWTDLWNTASLVVTTVWDSIGMFANQKWGEIVGWFHSWWDPIVAAWNTIWAEAERIFAAAWTVISTWAGSIWNSITTVFRSVWGTVTGWWDTFWNGISTKFRSIWSSILTTAAAIWNGLVTSFMLIASPIVNAWNSLWNTVGTIINVARTVITTVTSSIATFVASVWSGLVGVVASIWNGIKNAIVTPIVAAYSIVSGIVSSIASAVAGLVSGINSAVTGIASKLASLFSMQTAIAGMAVPSTTNPPPAGAQLAEGGVIRATPGGIRATIGEGGRDERVEPLDRQGLSNRDRALIAQIVTTMANARAEAGAPTTVQVMIGDQQLTGFITRVVEGRENDLARRVEQRRRRL